MEVFLTCASCHIWGKTDAEFQKKNIIPVKHDGECYATSGSKQILVIDETMNSSIC